MNLLISMNFKMEFLDPMQEISFFRFSLLGMAVLYFILSVLIEVFSQVFLLCNFSCSEILLIILVLNVILGVNNRYRLVS